MAKYYLTHKAVEDLDNIWNYTQTTWSEQQADLYYNMLVNACRKITENPRLFGLKYEEIVDGLYGFRANRHIIFYRILANDDILVIRILHQMMDLKHRVME
ncbi:MAG: type II toxin-antitoxin system RelE/ParE family toxin [Alistipes sp.]|nr:type II toxin-antitoxin system RelE/ParE family toxin [Alistipes sp.]